MGRAKQFLPFRGQTILEWTVDNALASSLDRVVVVLGHHAEALRCLVESREITVALNPRYTTGQSSSLQAGLRALTEEFQAVLFLLGDQPLVTPKTIDLILAAYQSSPSPIVIPVFEGRRGNPVLFRRDTFSRLEALDNDCGARPLFKEYTGLILRVPVPDSSIHFDIDTEEDYRRLLQLERQCPLSRSNQKKVRNTPPEGS